jgi:hypothetical protein
MASDLPVRFGVGDVLVLDGDAYMVMRSHDDEHELSGAGNVSDVTLTDSELDEKVARCKSVEVHR